MSKVDKIPRETKTHAVVMVLQISKCGRSIVDMDVSSDRTSNASCLASESERAFNTNVEKESIKSIKRIKSIRNTNRFKCES